MSPILEAFETALDAQEEFCGERLKASVGPVTDKDALVGEIDIDTIESAGGDSDAGGLSLQMRKSDFPAEPKRGQTVTAKGKTFDFQNVTESHGVYTITAFDASSENAD